MSVPPIQAGLPAAVDIESTSKVLGIHSSQHSDSEAEESHGPNPFSDPESVVHWKQAYEDSQYECRHAFDPTAVWTAEEERAVIRKVDWRVCLWAVGCHRFLSNKNIHSHSVYQCVMFFGLQVDRGNLVQAVSDNMLDDLKLTTDGE